ncbi:hypothetical protein KFL_000790330 [Klebsormidium nitens]|uniref:DUF218 domain-containing protein n=1 Tax=Klebsormidium nitens TaxID=105231 RepID=A0A1Y1HZX2_KLENI|nr:hypothetical protein KFL_000790330 [Klebsormidium nitens]|eukprot:GAQ81408.1 hypothetical protein KFL_000790330 [Klebsormidium nitens]
MGGGTSHKPPVLNKDGYVIHEGTSCAAYLTEKHGVHPDHILKEWASYDTIANGYFALTAHAIPRGWRRIMMVTSAFHFERSRLIFEWMFGLQGAGAAFHNDSASASASANGTGEFGALRIESHNGDDSSGRGLVGHEASQVASSFDGNGETSDEGNVGGMNGGAVARTPGSQGFSMHYLRASDEGIDADVIQARLQKEASSIRNLQKNLIPRIRTLPEMHRWLHIEHKAYNVADQAAFGEDPAKVKDPALASY